MKNTTILAIAATMIAAPTLALAKDGHGNKHDAHIHYQGPVTTTQVAELLTDTSRFTEKKVVVEGKLVRQLSADTFIFSDGKAEIQVELEDINFKHSLDHQTPVRLFGEYEGGSTPEIEVEHIQLVKTAS
ncbi:YgiW/YdeI family stress tolerance OB fold protein [Vibrio hippocampi]|uniref:Bacterial OB-fold domain-containing protein n=1 Tax=Vibrio hippocampi TaxID=654686 RepID=A0ABN8DKF7_9VIBR|nr:NirD/YgiW/YdeI family stress tolerance protein [Vibrio hippocampi]CAH0529610.1 hypothetical protein VHP8226_03365 [Vibrio hippocampi]